MLRAGCVNGDLHQTKSYKRVGLTWGSSATECPTTWRTPRQTEEHVPTSPIARACISIHSIGPSKPDDERVRAFFRALSSGASSSRGLLLPPFFFSTTFSLQHHSRFTPTCPTTVAPFPLDVAWSSKRCSVECVGSFCLDLTLAHPADASVSVRPSTPNLILR